MPKSSITASEAKLLMARMDAGAKEGRLLGVIMPNGKPLGDCTGEYVRQLGAAMEELGERWLTVVGNIPVQTSKH